MKKIVFSVPFKSQTEYETKLEAMERHARDSAFQALHDACNVPTEQGNNITDTTGEYIDVEPFDQKDPQFDPSSTSESLRSQLDEAHAIISRLQNEIQSNIPSPREIELETELERLQTALAQTRLENKELMLAGQNKSVGFSQVQENDSQGMQIRETHDGLNDLHNADKLINKKHPSNSLQDICESHIHPAEQGDGAGSAGSAGVSNTVNQTTNNDEEHRHPEQLVQQLRESSTNIARLQLANRILNDKVQSLEKANVTLEARIKRLNSQKPEEHEHLVHQISLLQKQIEDFQKEQEHLVPKMDLLSAQNDYDHLLRQFKELQDDYNKFMTDNCMEDLARAKTDLQEKNHQLEEEGKSLRHRIHDCEQDLQATQAEVLDLREAKKLASERISALQHALSRQFPSDHSPAETDGALLQEEVRILIDENLTLREHLEALEERLAALLQGSDIDAKTRGVLQEVDGKHPGSTGNVMTGKNIVGMRVSEPSRPKLLGMLKFHEKDTQRLVSLLVSKLDPATVRDCMPCIPAHLLFMGVLYADHEENASMLQGLLTNVMTAMKSTVQENAANLELVACWLACGYRLLANMKQFSGEPQFSSPDDRESATLNTFDLQEYRIVLSDLLVQFYHFVIKHVEHQLVTMIVPGMLEHESLPTSQTTLPNRRRGRSKTIVKVDDILHLLTNVYNVLRENWVDHRLNQQIFQQLFYLINAHMCNHLLLRKDLVRLTKGMQVRYNISKLEDWSREHNLEQACSSLVEAVQITQLLQCNKTKSQDIETIFQTCTKLKPLQVQKILQMYTPEDFEERVPASLIRAAQARVDSDAGAGSKLLMDTGFMHPITFPFTPSTPRFPSLDIPASIKLDFVTKI